MTPACLVGLLGLAVLPDVERNYSELGTYADQAGSAIPVTRAPLTYRVIRVFILRTFSFKYHSH